MLSVDDQIFALDMLKSASIRKTGAGDVLGSCTLAYQQRDPGLGSRT